MGRRRRARCCRRFGFLPRWRIDDVMVSFAATGGSVGAHVDQYDVFLLQAQGHRRWQIDAAPRTRRCDFRDDVELKLLREFHPTHDWVLGPGDMLYLPPGVPHHGVAEDACLTFSVGMRAPSRGGAAGRFRRHARRRRRRSAALPRPGPRRRRAIPNEIDAAAMARVVEALNALRMNDPDRLGDWFGRFITALPHRRRSRGRRTPTPLAHRVEWDLQQGARAAAPSVVARWPGASAGKRRRGCSSAARTSRCRRATRSASPAAASARRRRLCRAVARPVATRSSRCCSAGHYQLHDGRGRDERRMSQRPPAVPRRGRSTTRAASPTCARCARRCSCRNRACRSKMEWDALDPQCRARDRPRRSTARRSAPAG